MGCTQSAPDYVPHCSGHNENVMHFGIQPPSRPPWAALILLIILVQLVQFVPRHGTKEEFQDSICTKRFVGSLQIQTIQFSPFLLFFALHHEEKHMVGCFLWGCFAVDCRDLQPEIGGKHTVGAPSTFQMYQPWGQYVVRYLSKSMSD